MNKEEIVKALGICYYPMGRCKECPYNGVDDCNTALCRDALTVINMQTAIIEQYKHACETCKSRFVGKPF